MEGTVEIKSVSREAGERSKIAVYAKNSDIDAIGACVGQKGTRVRNIVEELSGEMIDIVQYSTDPKVFISNALSPAVVLNVIVDEENNSALAIVPDNQLSLAIGKRGQNARLAVRLTNWKIDIKSLSEAMSEGIDIADTKEEVIEPIVVDEPIVVEEIVEEVVETVEEIVVEETVVEEVQEEIIEETVEEVIEEQEVVEEVKPVVTYEEEDDYEYDDDDLSKYDEEIDYDLYDEYYDNH